MVRTFFRKSANPRVRAAVLEVLETRQFFDATLTPTADTFVRDGTSATTIYGNYALIAAKQGSAGVQRQIFEKFDLSNVSGTISHATLSVYGDRSNTNDATFTIAAAAMVNNSWSEATTNWNNKPAVGANVATASVLNTTAGWINLDVTSYLQQAKANGQSTVSIAIVGTANTDAYFEMSSREGTNSPQLILTTGSTAPAAPTNLTAPSVQTNAVTLNWADNSNNETGFQVQRKQGTGSWATLTTTSANATSYIDTTVSAGQSYSYQVIAVNAAGSSASSNTVNASVPTASTTTFTPTADTYVRDSTFSSTTFGTSGTAAARLSTTSTNNRQIYLKFDLSSLSGSVSSATLNVYGYRSNTNDSTFAIAAAQMSDNSWTESSTDWDNKPAVGSTISTANVPNTSYQWISLDVSSYIQAAKANNQSVVSIAIVGAAATTDYFTMLTRESQNAPQLVVASSTTTNAPAAPANVVATGASSKTVHVTWNDVATNETGYQVQYRLQGSTGAYTTLNLPAGSTSADITNLTAGTAYELQVTALGSTNSAAVAATASTLAAPVVTASSPKQEGASITLGVNLGSPAPSGVSYAWTLTGGTLSSTTAAAPTFTPADDGSYTAAVTVTYANGDTAAATSTINVANVAPTLGISGDSSVETGQTYTLSLSHTDPGTDTIQSWAINWGDGSAVETFTGADPTPTHVFNTDGNYTISATATDEDGTFSVSGPLIVAVAAAPVGTGYQASFNFEPDGAAAVPGYITDIGDQYDLGSSGYTFGWVDPLTGQPTKNSGATFDRQAVSDRRLDSGIDSVTSDGRTLSWEAAVPNGSYYVTLVAGDAEATSGAYSFDVEGNTGFLSGAASSGSGRWITATGVVTVNDGKLTINNGTGAVNHALAYVEITNATARSKATVSAPLNVVATAAGATSVDVRWEDASDNETQFTIERSSDGGNVWSTLGATAANAGLFTDTMASANTTYAYRVTAVNDVTGTSASSQSNTITTPLSDGQFPYNTGRTTWVTDQTIEAEDFDAGGQGVSYNDSIVGNAGGFYRSGNADVGYSLADNHYFVGWTRVGEWMEYTINVAAAGTYQLTASVACLGKGGTFEVLLNGAHTGSQLAIPDTGSFSTYQTINGSTGLTLPAGTTVLRLQAVDDSSPYYLGDMDWLELQRANTTAQIQLEATAANESETNLAWNDAVFGETGYVISQSTDGESFEPILTTPPNATGWSVKNLLPDTHYWFKVTAVTGEVDDASSNAAEAQTLPADLTPWDDLDIQFTAQHVTADIPAPSYFAAAIDSAHQYRLKYVSGADQFVADPFFTAQASLVDDAAIPNILSSAQHIDWYNSSPEVIEAEIAAAGGLFSDPVITQSHRLGARFDDPGYTDNNPSSPGVYWQLQSRSISGNVPTVSIASSIAQVTEPASLTDAPTTLRFVVARTGSVAADLPILLQPPAGTAALGSDYDSVPATVTIPAGQSSVSFDVAVNADNLTETDETVAVCIEASGLYRLGGSYSAFGTIHDVAGHAGTPVDNQAPIIVSAASVPSTAINALTTPLSVLGADDGGEANLTYTWSIFGDAPGPVTFSDNNDNAAKTVTATFTTSGTYRLQAVATDADGLSSDPSVVTVVVTLADAKPTVTIEATDPQAVEGAADDVLSFTVTRTGSTDQALVVQLASPTGTASEGEDYTALPRAITIPAGSSSALFSATPIADGVTEGDETVIERIAPDAAYAVGTPDTATGMIQDEGAAGGDSSIDLDLFEDANGDGIHDNSTVAEAAEQTSSTPFPVIGTDTDYAQLALVVTDAPANDSVTFEFPSNIHLFKDAWGLNSITSGQAIPLSEFGINGSGTGLLFGGIDSGSEAASPAAVQSVNVYFGGKAGPTPAFGGGIARAQPEPVPTPNDYNDNLPPPNSPYDNHGGLDDGDGDQTLTDRDGFWQGKNTHTLIIGFAGHTQSMGNHGTSGAIWDIDPNSGAYSIARAIHDSYPGFALTMFPEDPGNDAVLDESRCGMGVLGVPNTYAGGDRVPAPRSDGAPQLKTGALNFLVDAIENHGITNVGLFGYSHGGGSVHLLMQALAERASYDQTLANILVGNGTNIGPLTSGINLFWGAYIDAVHINMFGNGNNEGSNLSSSGTPFSESDFPTFNVGGFGGGSTVGPRSFYNIYQDSFVPYLRDGAPVNGTSLSASDFQGDGSFDQKYTDAAGSLWESTSFLDHTNHKGHGIAENGEVQSLVEQSLDAAINKFGIA